MTPEESQRLANIETSLVNLAGLPKFMERIQNQTDQIDRTLRDKQIKDAERDGEIDTQIVNMKEDIDGLGKKLRRHIGEHWKWVLATMTIASVIIGAASLFRG